MIISEMMFLCVLLVLVALHPSELAALHLCVGWNCHYVGVNRCCWMCRERSLESEKSSYLYIEAFPFISPYFMLALVITRICFHFSCIAVANAILY